MEFAINKLRHKRTDNTEKYYLKIDRPRAVKSTLGDRWKDDPIDREDRE